MINVKEYLPILIPLILLQFSLQIAAIIHILKHEKYNKGNRVLWIILSFVQFIGPVLYFIIGKTDEEWKY